MKVMVVFGTRPEIIKLAPVIAELKNKRIETVTCATGQHRQMLDQAMSAFNIEPDIDLNLMQPAQTLNSLSASLLSTLDKVYEDHSPDWILVQGDTTSAFCGAFSAFHRGIHIGHVEAGLRTGDISSPFPEEANRSMLAKLATIHFAPTIRARDNLRYENISPNKILVTGNTVVDAINVAKKSDKFSSNALPEPLVTISKEKKIVLITCHRRENFGEVLSNICKMLARLCIDYPEYFFVIPVHLNPSVREPIVSYLNNHTNILLIEPLDYHSTLYLISKSQLIISDSGGIQEEAPSFGTPIVVMRSHTERSEGIQAGYAVLAGRDADSIEFHARKYLDNTNNKIDLNNRPNPYGDGKASERIVHSILGIKSSQFNG